MDEQQEVSINIKDWLKGFLKPMNLLVLIVLMAALYVVMNTGHYIDECNRNCVSEFNRLGCDKVNMYKTMNETVTLLWDNNGNQDKDKDT
jgi:hypothetical protein